MTAPSSGLGLVLDCRDPEALARFWSAALRYVHLGSVEDYALLVPDDRPGPKLLLQRVPEGKTVKNRMHLDLETPGVDDEVARLVALGATRLETQDRHQHGSRWVVMADPEGNEFCVCTGGQPEADAT